MFRMIATDMIFEAKQLGPGARSFDLSMDMTRPMTTIGMSGVKS
jgi:hypothetical protein